MIMTYKARPFDLRDTVFVPEILRATLNMLGDNGTYWINHAPINFQQNKNEPVHYIKINEEEFYSLLGAIGRCCNGNNQLLNICVLLVHKAMKDYVKSPKINDIIIFNDTCKDFDILSAVVERAIQLSSQ